MYTSDYKMAAKEALRLRSKAHISIDNSFCIFDLSDNLGVEVKFVDIKSLEGAYIKKSKNILVSTYRPEGRLRFTCAHELGHFVFDHGDHFDELVEKPNSTEGRFEERLSDAFASFLLMPQSTIRSAFIRRGLDINTADPNDFLIVATWIGVGYTTILNHLRYGVTILAHKRYEDLIKTHPKSIKSVFCGFDVTSNLVIVDRHWNGRPVDLQVGDYLAVESPSSIQDYLELISESRNNIWLAHSPGITKLTMSNPQLSFMVRVRRKEYVGRAIFRHLEEEEHNGK